MGIDTPFMEAMERLPDEHKRQAEELRLANEECDQLKRELREERACVQAMKAVRDAALLRARLYEQKAQKLERLRRIITGPDDCDNEDW